MNEIRDFFDGLAPVWDERAKDDLSVVRGLLERAGIGPGDHVLDVACGTGVITGLLHDMTGEPVLGIDVSGQMIERAKDKYAGADGVAFRQGDFLAFDGGDYDAVVIYNAFPHFMDVNALCLALSRNLKPSGKFVIVHSLGRRQLSAHHDGLGPRISRELQSPQEEAKAFSDLFQIELAEEGEDFYLLVGVKQKDL